MKLRNIYIAFLAAATMLSSCGYNQMSGVVTGASLGGMLGGAVGTLSGGWRGHNRGTAIGILAGAAAGGAMIANQAGRRNRSRNSDENYAANSPYYQQKQQQQETYTAPAYTAASIPVRLQKLSFTDAQGKYAQSLSRNEECRIYFEIYNPTDQELYDIEPVIYEASGSKQVAFSPTTLITSLPAHSTCRYSAVVKGMPRLKKGEATIVVAVSVDGSDFVDLQSFTIQTTK